MRKVQLGGFYTLRKMYFRKCYSEILRKIKLLKKVPVFKIEYCKITYFRWDFISCFCHIVSLQQSKIRVMEG
jgi:hypothetical protein